MQTWWQEAKESPWWRGIKLAWARWAEVDGNQRAAAFAYYLLLSLLPLSNLLVSAGSFFVEREVATQALVTQPLFIHQLSHVWIDFRDIRDEFMREHDLDYFENSQHGRSHAQTRVGVNAGRLDGHARPGRTAAAYSINRA